MKQVALLEEWQKDQLIGQEYARDSFYNPIQDADGNWVISMEEVGSTIEDDFLWVFGLPTIDFNPKISRLPNEK